MTQPSTRAQVITRRTYNRPTNDTGTEFAPNMYNSVGYEPMTQLQGDTNKINPLGMNMRLPVAGTVSRKMIFRR